MKPRIETLNETILIGSYVIISLADNKTSQLWRGFMPRQKEIHHKQDTNFYSIEVYPPSYWDQFDPSAEFEKWAAVAVTNVQTVPDGMKTITLPEGLYAVFIHRGPASEGPKTYRYIFEEWLPQSDYALDGRPHFALMGDKYKNDDPSSEEEIWIPIKPKQQ